MKKIMIACVLLSGCSLPGISIDSSQLSVHKFKLIKEDGGENYADLVLKKDETNWINISVPSKYITEGKTVNCETLSNTAHWAGTAYSSASKFNTHCEFHLRSMNSHSGTMSFDIEATLYNADKQSFLTLEKSSFTYQYKKQK